MRGYTVTGTDTDVGKTVFAAGLTGWLKANYWKPVQAGLDGGTDRQTVRALSGLDDEHVLAEVYRLTTPCSPHQAAEIDDVVIDPARLALPHSERPLVVEGAGGVLVPVGNGLVMADLFMRWALPVILVARTSLGTINHSLLSLEALRARHIIVHGIVFSGDENIATETIITQLGKATHLGRLPFVSPLDAKSLQATFAKHINTDLLS
jgi:dethiobiotin synthetase